MALGSGGSRFQLGPWLFCLLYGTDSGSATFSKLFPIELEITLENAGSGMNAKIEPDPKLTVSEVEVFGKCGQQGLLSLNLLGQIPIEALGVRA